MFFATSTFRKGLIMSKKRQVTVFVRSFPVLSETFVLNQVRNLVKNNVDVSVLSVNPINDDGRVEREIFGDESSGNVNSIFTDDTNWKIYLFVAIAFLFCFLSPKRWPLVSLFMHLCIKGNRYIARDLMAIVWFCRKKQIASTNCIAHFGVNGVVYDHLIQAGLVECDHLFTVFHGYEISKFEQVDTWKKYYAKLNGTLLPISEKWKSELVRFGANPLNISVLRMGVDVKKFAFNCRNLTTPLKMLSVARATEKKGLAYAIEAALNSEMNCQLNIVGDGALLGSLKKQVNSHKNKERVSLLGACPPSEVALQLKQADLFILPSVRDSSGDMEGVPVSLMEAMASGVIVLSTFHSGIPELITDGETGFLVPERNVDALKEKINEIVNHQNLNGIRKSARLKVEKDFNSEKLTAKLIELLEENKK
jgi:colanic acid/amylovoran biosynthesis glycosyltransferase